MPEAKARPDHPADHSLEGDAVGVGEIADELLAVGAQAECRKQQSIVIILREDEILSVLED